MIASRPCTGSAISSSRPPPECPPRGRAGCGAIRKWPSAPSPWRHRRVATAFGGGTTQHAAKRNIPATTREYFGVWSEAPFGPPAYGLFARNVRGLALRNVRFDFAHLDLRPAVVLDHVHDVVIHGLSAQGHPAAESVLRFTGVRDALVTAARLLTPAPAFLQLEGEENANVTLDGGDFTKATTPVSWRDGATERAVRVRV